MGQARAEVLFPDHIIILDCKKLKKTSAPRDVIKTTDDIIVFYFYN